MGIFSFKKEILKKCSLFGFFGEVENVFPVFGEYPLPVVHTFPKIAKNINDPKIGKVSKIAQGFEHTLFLMSPKENVYGVGYSYDGTLFVKQEERLSLILVTSTALKGVKIGDIACDHGFSVLLSKNGVPYSCGFNNDGQCGVGTNFNVYSAIQMKIEEKIIQIDCGGNFTVLLTSKRDIYKTGMVYCEKRVNIPTKLNLNERVKFFRAGTEHLLVVGESEQLYGMGNNECNQLTSKLSDDGVNVLTKISLLKGNIKDVKCSQYDSYALMGNNDLYGWGNNSYGQSKCNGVITGSYPFNPTPFKMKSNVEQIEVGAYSCFVFCKEGVYVCGCNEYDQLGMGNNAKFSTLTLNENLSNIKRIIPKVTISQFDKKRVLFDIIIKTTF